MKYKTKNTATKQLVIFLKKINIFYKILARLAKKRRQKKQI